MAQNGFWDNPTQAQATVESLKNLKRLIEPWQHCQALFSELEEWIHLGEQDESALKHLLEETTKLAAQVDRLEAGRMLSDPLDSRDAILSINAGAGGTEACDWAGMLLRMYSRWAEKQGFEIESIDYLAGEEAGVKNVTFFVHGSFAYGYLKCERGVHRLVRISPFDSNKRRHTSFASVDVIAEAQEGQEIEVNPADLKIDTFRAGGAGGQHVNKTESAIRITHIPTGIVVQCQNERSQHKNKANAMRVLKARLLERKRQEEDEVLKKHNSEKKDIAWGSQIRSYVFQPYTLVKDHRTNFEVSDVEAVMNGEITPFIEAYLKQQVK
jgi:peptide chain release factor 2